MYILYTWTFFKFLAAYSNLVLYRKNIDYVTEISKYIEILDNFHVTSMSYLEPLCIKM